ncbi:hypothetical protein PC128_g27698 [Phytophthora cactorum]|nr:hypothetical protein C6341_g27703 [Phytophthora cactorum]KAG3122898.1 hypothetical protein PC128_g27698 [Phytophthora cactorum]
MESLTAAPASPVVPSSPPVVLPRVAPGQDSGFAPSIQPGSTVGPSPSKKLERSESPMGGTPDATPRHAFPRPLPPLRLHRHPLPRRPLSRPECR